MWKVSLILLAVIAIGISDGLIRRRAGSVGGGRRNRPPSAAKQRQCSQFTNVTGLCNLEDKQLIGVLFTRPPTPSTQREFMRAVRNAGYAQLCEELQDVLQCGLTLIKQAAKQCEDVFGPELKIAIPVIEVGQTFLQEICSGEYGDLDDHIECFTSYELAEATQECIYTVPPDLDMDDYITCSNSKMDEFSNICDDEAKAIQARIIRRGADLLRPIIRELGSRGPGSLQFMKRLLKF